VQGGFILSLALPEDDKFYDDKADILELNGLAEATSFTLRVNQEPPEQLLGFLRLINLSGMSANPARDRWPCFSVRGCIAACLCMLHLR
jgi:[ribulose-bisphosphate carboxylase]-lysine N-methyltransferase